jgi:cytochrome c oxidase subunit 2
MRLVWLVLSLALVAPESRAAPAERVIKMTVERFRFSPSTLELKLGESVVLEISSLDRKHGFAAPDFDVDIEVTAGKPVRVRLTATRAGTFAFHCSIFCGSGHEDMQGVLVVRAP